MLFNREYEFVFFVVFKISKHSIPFVTFTNFSHFNFLQLNANTKLNFFIWILRELLVIFTGCTKNAQKHIPVLHICNSEKLKMIGVLSTAVCYIYIDLVYISVYGEVTATWFGEESSAVANSGSVRKIW